MNEKITARELVISGTLLAAGIILPMIFHVFNMAGPMFLPMHIPVLIGGMLLNPTLALFLGILTPVMSSVLTGMPVAFPMAIIMAFELGTYGFVASISTRKYNLGIVASLIVSMIFGRIAAGLTVAFLSSFFGVKMNAIIYIKGAIVAGLPGLLIQLIFVPTLAYTLRKIINHEFATSGMRG